MSYETLSEQFLFFNRLPEADFPKKLKAFKGIRNNVITALGKTKEMFSQEFAKLRHSRYVYMPYEKSTASELLSWLLDREPEPQQGRYYQDMKEYLDDDENTTEYRKRLLREKQMYVSINYKGAKPDYDELRYIHEGSYYIFQKYKDTPEFQILMKLIGMNQCEETIREQFQLLLLMKELDYHIDKLDGYAALTDADPQNEKKEECEERTFCFDMTKVQDIITFCQNKGVNVNKAEMVISITTADFKNIYDKCNKKNCLRNTFMYISKTIEGSNKDQDEWYKKAANSIGMQKASTRKGSSTLPEGFDDGVKKCI